MSTLFKNIKELIQVRTEPISFCFRKGNERFTYYKNAYLLVENGLISDFGSMDGLSGIRG